MQISGEVFTDLR